MGMHDLFGVVDDPVTEAANVELRGASPQGEASRSDAGLGGADIGVGK